MASFCRLPSGREKFGRALTQEEEEKEPLVDDTTSKLLERSSEGAPGCCCIQCRSPKAFLEGNAEKNHSLLSVSKTLRKKWANKTTHRAFQDYMTSTINDKTKKQCPFLSCSFQLLKHKRIKHTPIDKSNSKSFQNILHVNLH